MAAQTGCTVPVEIIAAWSDAMPASNGTDPVTAPRPLQPGEGVVDCAIIHEFADSGAPRPVVNGAASQVLPLPKG
jgi:hypothetical protein